MKYKIIFLNVFTAAIIIFSCNKNKLNQPALGLLDDAALANKSGVEGLLIGAYALLDGVSADDPGMMLLAAIIRGRPIGSMEAFAAAKLTRARS